MGLKKSSRVSIFRGEHVKPGEGVYYMDNDRLKRVKKEIQACITDEMSIRNLLLEHAISNIDKAINLEEK